MEHAPASDASSMTIFSTESILASMSRAGVPVALPFGIMSRMRNPTACP